VLLAPLLLLPQSPRWQLLLVLNYWRPHLLLLMLCCITLAGALLLASLLLLPESPRWLVLRGQLDLALATLHKTIESSGSASTLDGADRSQQQVGAIVRLTPFAILDGMHPMYLLQFRM
jgi:hypothetical protein